MRTRARRLVAAVFLIFGVLLAGQSLAVPPGPESGFYVTSLLPNSGFTIERQGDRVGLIIYSYTSSGSPEFYSGGGALVPGGRVLEVPFFGLDSFESSKVTGELFRSTGGRDLGGSRPLTPAQPTRIGTFGLSFVTHDSALLDLTFDPAFPSMGETFRSYLLSRINYGYGAFGTSGISATRNCIFDYRGQWVFVDQSAPSRDAWRYNFTEVTPDPAPTNCGGNDRWSVVFRDPIRNAELRCAMQRLPDPATGLTKQGGCELYQDGQIQFSIYYADLGLERMVGFLGFLGNVTDDFARRPEIVIGMRVK